MLSKKRKIQTFFIFVWASAASKNKTFKPNTEQGILLGWDFICSFNEKRFNSQSKFFMVIFVQMFKYFRRNFHFSCSILRAQQNSINRWKEMESFIPFMAAICPLSMVNGNIRFLFCVYAFEFLFDGMIRRCVGIFARINCEITLNVNQCFAKNMKMTRK